MKTILNILLALFLPLSLPALAAEKSPEQSPEAMVKQITVDVLDAIKKDKDLQSGDKKKALALAEEKVLPHLDFEEMTKLAAARNWNTATPAQREKLVTAFRAMLVRTYANSIDVYRGQTMTVVGAKVPHMSKMVSEGTNDYFVQSQQVGDLLAVIAALDASI